jgi:hypothetical protein
MTRARDMASRNYYKPGEVIQTQYVQSSARQTISAADVAAITALTINITPRFANSRILLRAMVNSSATYVSTYSFLKNDTQMSGTVTNNNSSGGIATVYQFDTSGNNMENIYLEYMDTASSTALINYKVAACSSWAGTSYNLYINDRSDSTMLSISTFTVQEIAQ